MLMFSASSSMVVLRCQCDERFTAAASPRARRSRPRPVRQIGACAPTAHPTTLLSSSTMIRSHVRHPRQLKIVSAATLVVLDGDVSTVEDVVGPAVVDTQRAMYGLA